MSKIHQYYLKRCQELGIATDIFDVEAETDSSLSYSEQIAELEDKYFSNFVADATLEDAKQQQLKYKDNTAEFKQNWELLSKARSIYILAGVRAGKSAFAFGLAKLLQPYKKVYYFNFPQQNLLKKEGFFHLDNLNEISQITDAVIVMDEIALTITKYEKKNNDELQKILTLAGQNNLTLIFISQISQMINKTLEGLIDCFVVMDIEYQNLKNGSKAKNMIKDYCTFQPEYFRLTKGEFLFHSRNFQVFEKHCKFTLHPSFTEEWSLAYKNKNKEIESFKGERVTLISFGNIEIAKVRK